MEQAPQSEPKVPSHVVGEVAMRAANTIDALPKADPEIPRRVAVPPDLISGPLRPENAKWHLDVVARGKAIQRRKIAEDIAAGRLDPREMRAH